MKNDGSKKASGQSSSASKPDDQRVDDALKDIFDPILEDKIPPEITALLDSLVQKKKQEK